MSEINKVTVFSTQLWGKFIEGKTEVSLMVDNRENRKWLIEDSFYGALERLGKPEHEELMRFIDRQTDRINMSPFDCDWDEPTGYSIAIMSIEEAKTKLKDDYEGALKNIS